MGSVRELEAKSAIERKELMQAIFNYLRQSGLKAELFQEPALDLFGVSIFEPVVQVKEQSIDKIRLIWTGNANCRVPGNILRFQYELHLGKELSNESIQKLNARTKTVKIEKVIGLFGGKIVGVKWIGWDLAGILNQDKEISEVLLRCVQSWGEMEFEIEGASASEIHIIGPMFANPKTIMVLYEPGKKYEEQNCVFGYKTAERIAGHIKAWEENSQSQERIL